jgi:hypothetical protein
VNGAEPAVDEHELSPASGQNPANGLGRRRLARRRHDPGQADHIHRPNAEIAVHGRFTPEPLDRVDFHDPFAVDDPESLIPGGIGRSPESRRDL